MTLPLYVVKVMVNVYFLIIENYFSVKKILQIQINFTKILQKNSKKNQENSKKNQQKNQENPKKTNKSNFYTAIFLAQWPYVE